MNRCTLPPLRFPSFFGNIILRNSSSCCKKFRFELALLIKLWLHKWHPFSKRRLHHKSAFNAFWNNVPFLRFVFLRFLVTLYSIVSQASTQVSGSNEHYWSSYDCTSETPYSGGFRSMSDVINALLSDEPLWRFVFRCFNMLEGSTMDKATAKVSGSNEHSWSSYDWVSVKPFFFKRFSRHISLSLIFVHWCTLLRFVFCLMSLVLARVRTMGEICIGIEFWFS